MDFVTNSEYLIWLAKWIGIFSFVLVALISIQILVLRAMLVKRQNRAEALHAVWQPILVACLDESPKNIPDLEDQDVRTFLVLWNYFHEILREAGKDNLNDLATRLKLATWSKNALKNGSIRDRLLAIQTLGWIREQSVWDELIAIMETGDPVTSLCAAKAILRIDPEQAVELFIPLIAIKPEWSFSTVGKLLKEAGAPHVTKPLIRQASQLKGAELVRILRFIDTAYEEDSAPLVSRHLRESEDPDVIMSCLRAVENPNDLPVIRELLKHVNWRIRTQAASTLGMIGTDEDIPRLIHAAGDQDWWVRYRSAIALAALPSMTNNRLKEIAQVHQNIFASEIIEQIRKEKEAFQK